ncbi:MAG: hypothetical protein CMC43_06520 [Flavobacteriaceae bacterium]|nr:hypothetical protein [Flavobacteriaceae bacterium]
MNKQSGVSLIEAMVAAVVVGIGFVAIYGITTSSTRVLLNSIDREKGNMLANMIMEDIIIDTQNLTQYHNLKFISSPSSQTTTVEKKQQKWKITADQLFSVVQNNSSECIGGNPREWRNCHYRKVEVVETSNGSKVYTISVHLSNRDGRAVNTFKRIINSE